MSLFDTEVEDSSVEQEFENTVQQTIQSTTEDTEDPDDTVVDLLSISEFSEAHLDVVRNLYGPVTEENPFGGWPKVFPELYGNKLPDALVFKGWEIYDSNIVDLKTQKFRVGGISLTKYDAIKQNIERNGYKLKYPAVSWFFWNGISDTDGKDAMVITGTTRGAICKEATFNISNMIVARYEAREGYSVAEIEDAIEVCGLRFNAIHDPANPLDPESVVRGVQLMIERFIETDGQAGIPNTIDAITDRVDLVCGEGVFQPQTRQLIIYRIYNHFNPNAIVLSYSKSQGKILLLEKQKLWKFFDTDKVKYLFTSAELVSKTFINATALSSKFPEAEIRIVLHTGTLTGFDLLGCYENRIKKFINKFDQMIRNSCLAFFQKANPKKNNITIYAAYPALGAFHDLNLPFLVKEKSSIMFQKGTSNQFDFSLGATLPLDDLEDPDEE